MTDTDTEADTFDPSEHTVDEVLEYLHGEEDDAKRIAVIEAERAGKARKGVMDHVPDELGPLGATTTKREDFLGRNIVSPTGTATDFLGRATTSTVDFLGRNMRRDARANSAAVTLGQEIQYPTGEKFVVTTAGSLHATVVPAVPAVGATVTDGTAVLTRQR